MIKELPIVIILSYTVFSLFQFYQTLHVKNFRGGSQGALLAINISAFIAMGFSYGYLIYYGYSVAWHWPIILFVIALIVKSIWFFVEAKLKLTNHVVWFSLSGFLVLPIAAFILINYIP